MTPLDCDFEAFWKSYPRRVGKLAARKAYDKVRRGGISQQELLDGIAQYRATKPAYADWCHPRTWLSQGRWMDEAPESEAKSYEFSCPHTPPCSGRNACDVLQRIAAGKLLGL